jgi:hypothetical protein
VSTVIIPEHHLDGQVTSVDEVVEALRRRLHAPVQKIQQYAGFIHIHATAPRALVEIACARELDRRGISWEVRS